MREPVVSKPLLQKEVQQNGVIYLAPFLFLVLVWFVKSDHALFFSSAFAPAVAIAVPAALALAYGVQAFDLEEQGLTRDFLLVKPLTVSQIVNSKYAAGLVMLIAQSLLWKIVLAPQIIQWPSIPNLQGFIFLAALFLEVIVYSAAFLAGIYIKGPLKIIGALCGGALAGLWFFCTWFACLQVLMQQISYQYQLWPYLVLLGCTLLEFAVLLGIIHCAAQIRLKNIAATTKSRTLSRYALLLLLIPGTLLSLGWLTRPVIYPAAPLPMLFKGEGAWFQAIQGAQQPGKPVYALSDALGRLGLAENGVSLPAVPRLIYQSRARAGSSPLQPLTDLKWSPDGRYLSFCDRGKMMIYSMETRKIKSIFPGNVALWSRDSQQLLIGQIVGRYLFQTARGNLPGTKVRFTLENIAPPGTGAPLASFDLAAPNIALAWDSRLRQLIILDPSWTIRVANLQNGAAAEVRLPQPDPTSRILYAKIVPARQGKDFFLIQVYSSSPARIKKDSYEIQLYLFNAANHTSRFLAGFKGIADVIAAPLETEILTAPVRGIYRRTILSREAH